MNKSIIVIFGVIALMIVAGGWWMLRETDPQPQTVPVTVEVTRLVPVYLHITPQPEPDIPGDLWRCLQNPTLALDAPDVTLDYNTFDVMDLRITSVGDRGEIYAYQVFNSARNEAKSVTVEYGINAEEQVVLVRCDVPLEWGNFPPPSTPYPLSTPVNAPGEGVGQPES